MPPFPEQDVPELSGEVKRDSRCRPGELRGGSDCSAPSGSRGEDSSRRPVASPDPLWVSEFKRARCSVHFPLPGFWSLPELVPEVAGGQARQVLSKDGLATPVYKSAYSAPSLISECAPGGSRMVVSRQGQIWTRHWTDSHCVSATSSARGFSTLRAL